MSNRIEATLVQEKKWLEVTVHQMPDTQRDKGFIATSGKFRICSITCPEITIDCGGISLFLPGSDRRRDLYQAGAAFSTEQLATTSRIMFTLLLNKINSGTTLKLLQSTTVGDETNRDNIIICFHQYGTCLEAIVKQIPEHLAREFEDKSKSAMTDADMITISSIKKNDTIYHLLMGARDSGFLSNELMVLNVNQGPINPETPISFFRKYETRQEATKAMAYFVELIAKFNAAYTPNNRIVVSVQ